LGGSKHFSDAAATEESRKRFADSAVVFLRDHGFDGIDLDWEYPVADGRDDNIRRPEDRENFTLLLEALRAALNAAGDMDRRRYLLTIAAAASEKYVANTELEKIARTVDWVGLMSYDFAGAWSKTSGHNAPLFSDPANPSPDATRNTVTAAVMRHLEAGVPPEKLLLGLSLSGRTWRGCDRETTGNIRNAPVRRRSRPCTGIAARVSRRSRSSTSTSTPAVRLSSVPCTAGREEEMEGT